MTQDKEPIRKFRWGILVESLFRDFRFALRGLGRDRRLALAAIFALSLGIGAMTVIFGVVHSLMFDPFPYRDSSRLAAAKIARVVSYQLPLAVESDSASDASSRPFCFCLCNALIAEVASIVWSPARTGRSPLAIGHSPSRHCT